MCDTPPKSGGGYFRHSTPQEVNRNFLCHFGILNIWRSKSYVCNKCQHNSQERKKRGEGPTRKWGIFILVAYCENTPIYSRLFGPSRTQALLRTSVNSIKGVSSIVEPYEFFGAGNNLCFWTIIINPIKNFHF